MGMVSSSHYCLLLPCSKFELLLQKNNVMLFKCKISAFEHVTGAPSRSWNPGIHWPYRFCLSNVSASLLKMGSVFQLESSGECFHDHKTFGEVGYHESIWTDCQSTQLKKFQWPIIKIFWLRKNQKSKNATSKTFYTRTAIKKYFDGRNKAKSFEEVRIWIWVKKNHFVAFFDCQGSDGKMKNDRFSAWIFFPFESLMENFELVVVEKKIREPRKIFW